MLFRSHNLSNTAKRVSQSHTQNTHNRQRRQTAHISHTTHYTRKHRHHTQKLTIQLRTHTTPCMKQCNTPRTTHSVHNRQHISNGVHNANSQTHTLKVSHQSITTRTRHHSAHVSHKSHKSHKSHLRGYMQHTQ